MPSVINIFDRGGIIIGEIKILSIPRDVAPNTPLKLSLILLEISADKVNPKTQKL